MRSHIKELITAAFLGTAAASLAQDNTEAVQGIVAVYENVEANYKKWPHATVTRQAEGAPTEVKEDLWRNGDGLARIEVVNMDDHGPITSQYIMEGDQLIFVFKREEYEAMQPKAPTKVTEKRYYFSYDELIRALEKRGTFPAGKKADMSKVANKPVPLDKVEGADYPGFLKEARDVIARLGAAASRKTAVSAVPIDKLRQIEETVSLDGSMVLAWGVEGDNASAIAKDDEGHFHATEPGEHIGNYVLDLVNKKVLGKTAGQHGSDTTHYRQAEMSNSVFWSSHSEYFVQVGAGKRGWAAFAELYQVDADSRQLTAGLDLLPILAKALKSKLKAADAKSLETGDLSIDEIKINHGENGVEMTCKFGLVPPPGAEFTYESEAKFKVTTGGAGKAPKLTPISATTKKVKIE